MPDSLRTILSPKTPAVSLPAPAGAAGMVLLAALLGAPGWPLAILTLVSIAMLAVIAGMQQRRDRRGAAAISAALERLGAGAAPAGMDAETLARRLEALADALAARLDESRLAGERGDRWLNAVPDPLLVIDQGDIIRICNRAAAELLELPLRRIVGRGIDEIFTQPDLLRTIALARRSGTVRLHLVIPRSRGNNTWEVAGGDAGGEVVLMLRDVTEQALALQVKTDFVANASHELRTPIAALRTAVETLSSLDEHDPPAMRERLMGMIAGNIASLEEMARDLLDLSRVEAEEAEVRWRLVDMETIAASLAAMFDAVCRERQLELRFEINPRARNLWSDPDLLSLILRNLIDNSTRFAREGSAVRITIAPLERAAAEAAGAGGGGGVGGVRIEVIDRGQGIPLSSQQRIFERYFQVDTARTISAHRRGSGLGLAIVKHAVRRLGGTIRVHSVWQQGTTMTIDLPGAGPEEHDRPRHPDSGDEPQDGVGS
jgi:two-component system, OmpR family, phosphate regulon sensor histidine kinase PhoR